MDEMLFHGRRKAVAEELPLFAMATPEPDPATHRDDPETSRRAADRVSSIAGALRIRVLHRIREAGGAGLTALELERLHDFAEYGASTVRKRVSELSQLTPPVIEKHGVRDGCAVWVAVG